jgi:hypothetical protein
MFLLTFFNTFIINNYNLKNNKTMSNIEVFVRMRPFNERELSQNLTN